MMPQLSVQGVTHRVFPKTTTGTSCAPVCSAILTNPRRRRSKKTGAWILKEEAAAPPRAAESQGVVLDLADHVREAELIEKVRAKVQAVPADAVGAPILSAQKRASWLKTASTLSSTAPPRIRLVASRAQTAPAQAGARPQQLGSSPQLLQRDERAL